MRPLRALFVDDSEDDVQLLLLELRKGEFDVEFERVDTAVAMTRALDRRVWDIIFCDYSMPRFSARAAVDLMREKSLDLPFIIVSGAIGEETAVDAMRSGVHDYILKGKLARLLPAVDRELGEAKLRGEQKRIMNQLMISERMASMGMLAAGVAHEINNPLSCVMANLDLVARDVVELAEKLGLSAEFQEIGEELHDARDAAERIRNIVRDLKIFSRAEEEKTGPVDIQRILESSLRMAWNEIRHRARLVKNYGKTAAVEASESRLGQVFLNLIVNAAQAIAEGHAEHNEIRITTAMDAGGLVTVEITDTGSGMTPEVLGRLFTPFFTTRPTGAGTGLGLSICHRIVTGFGGSILVQSEVGKGTTFRILLPAARGEPIHEVTNAIRVASTRRRGRIMLVDDESMISNVVRRALSADHDVVVFERADDALKQIADGARFDVVLCDLMMPQMTGMDLHAEIDRIAPEQAEKMIFLTGGAFTIRARTFLDEMPNQRIEKPFNAHHLRALINDRIRSLDEPDVSAEFRAS